MPRIIVPSKFAMASPMPGINPNKGSSPRYRDVPGIRTVVSKTLARRSVAANHRARSDALAGPLGADS